MSECIECKEECGVYRRIHSNCYNKLKNKIEIATKALVSIEDIAMEYDIDLEAWQVTDVTEEALQKIGE